MPRYFLEVAYKGAAFHGFQIQDDGGLTVQGEVNRALQTLFRKDVQTTTSSRTDAGVHARGQVAHLEVAETRLNPEQIKIRMNDELGHAINILHVEKAHPKFHARHDARSRSYTYQISKRRDAFGKKYVWWVRDPLDLRAMREAASRLEGFHDFRSFGATEKDGQSTLVDLDRIEIVENGDRIYIHIKASHFLWKMVRRIVGVLVEVGRGKMTGQEVETFLKTNSREPARFTAPPSGLFLERVEY